MINVAHKDVKLPKNTILGSINQVHDVDSIQEVSRKKIQDTENETINKATQDPQTQKLLPAFPNYSNFQIHANDDSKPAIMLQDTDILQAARDKVNKN